MLVGELAVALKLDTAKFNQQFSAIEQKLKTYANKSYTVTINAQGGNFSGQVASLKQVQQETQKASQQMGFFGHVLRNTASFMIGYAIVQTLNDIGGAIAGVIPIAADFEHQMAAVEAVLQGKASGQQIDQLREMALVLGQETVFTASEAAGAIEMLAKNGLNATQIMDGAAEATLNLAAATGTNLTNAADIATSTMLAFNLEASDMGNVIDSITGVVLSSKFSIDDYRLAMGQAGGVAGGLGVDLQDFNAAIALTSPLFNSGSDAGTSYKNFLLRLAPTTAEARNQMQQLGIITADGTNRFFDATGALKGTDEIAAILAETLGQLSPEMQAMATKEIFGVDSARMALGLMQVTSAEIAAMYSTLENTSAAQQAEIRLSTLQGSLEQLKGASETFAINLGSRAIPALTDFVDSLIPLVNMATTVTDAIFGNAEAFNSLPSPVQAAITVIQSFSSFIGGLASSAYSWGANIANQFGAGLLSAASAVTSSLMEMGSWISYWLQPGSPPRIVPDLDKWGQESGQLYIDSFTDADFSSLNEWTSLITDVLKDVDEDVDPTTIIAFQNAFSQLTNDVIGFGAASAESMSQLLAATENVSRELLPIISNYVQYRNAIQQVTHAQENLNEVSEALVEVQNRLRAAKDEREQVEASFNEAVQPWKDQVEFAERSLDIINLEAAIKERQRKLDEGFGMSAEALRVLELEQMRDMAELAQFRAENEWDAQRTAARLAVEQIELEEDAAQREVRARQEELDLAEERRDFARQEYELSRQRLDVIREQNRLMREQSQPSTSGGGGGGSAAAGGIDADQAAQERYNYELADTAGRLDILRNRLAGVAEGSKEWYDLQLQIRRLEEQQSNEQTREAERLAKEEADRIKAQEDYQYSLMDTGGKLDFLRDKLKGVEEGSVEYYRILGQIQSLETQALSGGAAGGTGGGMPGMSDEATAEVRRVQEETARKLEEQRAATRQAVKDSMEEQRANAERRRVEAENMRERQAQITAFIEAVKKPFVEVGTFISQAWSNLWNDIKTTINNTVLSIQSFLTVAFAFILEFWERNGADILATADRVWNELGTIIRGVISIVLELFSGFGESTRELQNNQSILLNVLTSVWEGIKGMFLAALNFIKSIIFTTLALMRGDWDMFLTGLSGIILSAFQFIQSFIYLVLNTIATFMGTNLDEMGAKVKAGWDYVVSMVTIALTFLSQKIVEGLAYINTQWDGAIKYIGENTKKGWDYVVEMVSTALNFAKDTVVSWISDIQSKWTSFVDFIKDELKSKFDLLPSFIGSALSDMLDALTGQTTTFTIEAGKLGQAIVTGIVNKIKDGLSAITNAARSAAQSAFDRAIAALTGQGGETKSTATMKSTPTAITATQSAQTVNNFNIDAKGSQMSADEFKRIVIDVTNQSARRAARLG